MLIISKYNNILCIYFKDVSIYSVFRFCIGVLDQSLQLFYIQESSVFSEFMLIFHLIIFLSIPICFIRKRSFLIVVHELLSTDFGL